MAFKFEFISNSKKGINAIEDVVAKFNKLTTDMIQFNKIENDLDALLVRASVEQIASEGKRGGTEYEELKEPRTTGGGILINTGQLFQDILKGFKIKKERKNQGQDVNLSIDNDYAILLQTGTKYMPARPILVLTSKDKKEIRELLVKSIKKARIKK